MSAITATDYTALDLPDLLGAINAEHGRATRSARTTIDHATRCGEMLVAAKSKVAHGQWESWLDENTEVSLRTSQRYMRLASNTTAVSLLDGDMGIAEALEMISTPSTPEPVVVGGKAKVSRPAATVTVETEVEVVEPDHVFPTKNPSLSDDSIKRGEEAEKDSEKLWLLKSTWKTASKKDRANFGSIIRDEIASPQTRFVTVEKLNEILKLLNIAIVNCCQIEFSEALENGDLEEAKRCVVNFDITREKLCLADEMLSEIRKDKGGRP